jgi:2,3-bisphosphoglycerate-independent phosphoglycerate mutase
VTKYAIIIPDGAADEPLEELGGQTVFEAAQIPNIDKISSQGKQGIVRTIPADMEPGSDVAQMSILGYDPKKYYTGRAPIEAVARNIDLSPQDWIFRCNLVTICDGKMADHSAGHISTEEANGLIKELNECFGNEQRRVL